MTDRAIVRPPGASYPSAITRQVPPPPVDLPAALTQHRAYVAALAACGAAIIELPPDDEHPDSVFVQDPVVVVDALAIALRSAVASRRGEARQLVEVLERYMPVASLQPPGTLDGGDVLVTDGALYVGMSARSNLEGCRQLERLTARPVVRVPLPEGMLHLLTGCTWLDRSRLLTVPALASAFPQFETVIVPEDEAAAANVLIVGAHAVMPLGHPGVADLLEAQGFTVHVVPCSEFEKRDGGVTCRALLF